MTDIYKNFHTETIEGFEVRLRFIEEDIYPDGMCGDDEVLQGIYAGNYCWLVACVEVFKCGVELGNSYIGGICYEWNKLEDFVKDVFQDMAQDAIAEARAKLQELRAA